MAEPLILGEPSDRELSEQLLSVVWRPRSRLWLLAFAAASAGTGLFFLCAAITVSTGIGVFGNNIPVAWAFDIINFVWWVGIGHAGTFISAILLLLEQKWRTSINRFAEGMTLFAVIQAAMYPLLHLGRPWFGYWLVPYPSTLDVWPQFRSALPWDAAAIATYFTVSLLFWYVGLIPDFASLRDRAPGKARRVLYGIFALGWRGSTRQLTHYRVLYGLLAGLATPLVISVHSIVSSDFAMGLTPGWHATIFPPFFVAGAIFSGFAMVLTLLLPVRRMFGLENVVTQRHIGALAKMILVTAWIVIGSYIIEFFAAWYSGSEVESYQFFVARPTAPGAGVFWVQMVCNALVPQLLWSRRVRESGVALWIISVLVNVGMWAERYVIIVLSLQREFLPAQWGDFSPSWVDIGLFTGTLGFFSLLFLIFLRLFPFIPVSEVKELNHELRKGHG
ncbi:NrfD/PsrC family molybdoenzyme membrane anchor subunit [Chondromyces apiculatus]|uniref:Molybdopterin oxidoreductase n=1 Tax=Chondromyces apiculatus DSM 436 TaxID=1192034 RepID=A0A017TCD1_9BACT|nr:NrfD/PsrC family molybdoenzyme membrane anchor subunit [Chondromyces apiculatus]EYF06914.1 Molybdopterin oxidoreductase [Chondromyces apiculatus DSM 436]